MVPPVRLTFALRVVVVTSGIGGDRGHPQRRHVRNALRRKNAYQLQLHGR